MFICVQDKLPGWVQLLQHSIRWAHCEHFAEILRSSDSVLSGNVLVPSLVLVPVFYRLKKCALISVGFDFI